MVHKKSEYQLKYRWNPSNLYQAAWANGQSYRVQRRLYDYSHLPLPWESYGCECDEEVEEEQETQQLPLTKTRLKHNVLKEVWERSKREAEAKEAAKIAQPLNQPVGDWYRQWEEKEHKKPSPTNFVNVESSFRKARSEERRPSLQKPVEAAQTLKLPERVANLNGKTDEEKEKFQQEISLSPELYRRPISPSRLTRGTQTFPGGVQPAKSPSLIRKELQATPPVTKPSCAPKFLPYGWASRRDVGDKKTFNVFAPTRNLNQFYSSALRAWKRRECDIVDSLREEMRPKSYSPFRSSTNVYVNPSSIWMTEYQKEFSSPGRHSPTRPMTAPPGRHIGSSYHKWCA